MADVSMCRGHGCVRVKHCLRYTAIPNPIRQSWLGFPQGMDMSRCGFFIRNQS